MECVFEVMVMHMVKQVPGNNKFLAKRPQSCYAGGWEHLVPRRVKLPDGVVRRPEAAGALPAGRTRSRAP